MKEIKKHFSQIHFASRIIMKYGVIFSLAVLLFAFFVPSPLGIKMCVISTYMFAEAIIFGLLTDVISKRQHP